MAPFLNRAAIAWDAEIISSDSCYWDKAWLNLLQDERGPSISYSTLISTACFVVSDLRAELTKQARKKRARREGKTDKAISMPIVVAIPEGPLLPLAILIVHALNNPIVLDSNYYCFAVLVPLEPSEPRKRNLHILKDISPAMILTTPGNDTDKLQEMINSISFEESPPTLLNFPQLVQSAIRELKSQQSLIKKLLSDSSLLNEDDIGTLISTWADRLTSESADGDRKETLRENVNTHLKRSDENPRVSHIVYTSGTTGIPKGCISSIASLKHYLRYKNKIYTVAEDAKVLLASALSFDPCLSDCLATFEAKATLAVAPRSALLGALPNILHKLQVTHVLCTPTLWSLMAGYRPQDFPSLRVVALGGEPIPRQLQQSWARKQNATQTQSSDYSVCRLFATYGVTEACVYQTCGEMFSSEQGNGQCVGQPFPGLGIRICREDRQESLVNVDPGAEGEIVLYGSQLDNFSGYLKRSELDYKFVSDARKGTSSERCVQHYRTGDRGTYDEPSGMLRVGGRILGEEAMVKVNGVRVELGEIENSLIDEIDDGDQSNPVVLNCMAKVVPVSAEGTGSLERNEIMAYCVLSDSAQIEVGISDMHNSAGFFVNGGPLTTLLRARCAEKVKLACIPKAFVVIPRLPLSPTGKCDRNGLPKLESCSHLGNADQNSLLLNEYGVAGSKIAEVLTECLNLQPSQESILTTTATFAMVGGDSMAAIRVTRALYAYHHKVANNRFLGGEFGKFTGPFDVVNLLRSENLGAYVQMLDSQNLCRPNGHEDHLDETNKAVDLKPVDSSTATTNQSDSDNGPRQGTLYDAMFQATTLGQSSIAIGLLSVGADPNFGLHSGRLGKVTHRLQQRALFRSSPLHIACLRGDDRLVKKLLEKNSKFNSPDASGMFPIHLASSGTSEESRTADEEDLNRLCCLQYLLQAGAPMAMRDGNKQSVLHCAARAGHCELLKYVMTSWKEKNGDGDDITPKHFFNWRDRWMRTPVHWAVLNGQVGALEILLQMGCSATPFKPKVNNRSSAAVESPMEMCERLYDPTNKGKGAEIQLLLLSHTKPQTEANTTPTPALV